MRVQRMLLAMTFVLALLLGTTGSVGGAKRVRYGGLLNLGSKYDLHSIDPVVAENPAELMIVSWVFDRLVRYDRRGEPRPGIANAWVSNDDHTTWDFNLRQGVKFHDGTPLTAEDVKVSLERLIKSRHPVGKFLARTIRGAEEFVRGDRKSISGIVVRSSHKLSVLSDAPQPGLLELLALPACSIVKVSPAGVEGQEERAKYRVLGSGPFAFSQSDKTKVILSAFDSHMQGRPYLDRIEMGLKTSSRQQLILFRLGKLDFMELNFSEKASLEKENVGVLINSPQFSTIVLGINKQSPVFNRPAAREAVARSIEREVILKVLLKGEGRLATGYLPPEVAEFAGLRERPHYQPNPSRSLFQQGQKTPEEPLSLITRMSDEYSSLIVQRIAVNLRDLGLRAQIESLADEAFDRRMRERKFDLFLDSLPMGSMDAWLELFSVFVHYAAHMTAEEFEKAMDLWSSAEASSQPHERSKLLYFVERQLLEEHTLEPLFHVTPSFLVSPKIAGLWIDVLGGVRIEDAWRR